MKQKSISVAALAKALGRESSTLAGRLKSGKGWHLEEVLALRAELDVSIDLLSSMLFSTGEDNPSANVARLERQAEQLRLENQELRGGRFEPQGVIREILLTGEFAVSALPVMAGPGKDVLTSIRLSVSSLADSAEDLTPETLAQRLNAKAPQVLKRSVVLATSIMQRPSIPGVRDMPPRAFLDIAVPVFDENRPEKDPYTPQYTGRGVLIVATTTGAWSGGVAALVARALGWSLTSTRELARRRAPAPEDRSTARRFLRIESENQLRSWLHGQDRPTTAVYSHWGVSDVIDGVVDHPLIAAINARTSDASFPTLPFIVLLHEDEDVLTEYGALPLQGETSKNTIRRDKQARNRDALLEAVQGIRDPKSWMDIPVRSLNNDSPEGRSEAGWERNADLATRILRKLLAGDSIHVEDQSAKSLLGLDPTGLFR